MKLFLEALYKPWFSAAFIKDYTLSGKGLHPVLLVLILICLVFVPLISIKPSLDFNRLMTKDFLPYLDSFPDFTISGGTFESSEITNYPFIAKIEDTEFLRIDPDFTMEQLNEDSTPKMIITRSQLIIKKDDGSTRINELSQIELLIKNKADLVNYSKNWYLALIIIIPFIMIYFFIAQMIKVLISLFAASILMQLGTKLKGDQLFRLAAVTTIPMVEAHLILSVLNIEIPFQFFIILAVNIIFLAVYRKQFDSPPAAPAVTQQ